MYVLPVSFRRAPDELRRLITSEKPDVVVMIGQCASSENIRIERYAHNMMDCSKPDNDGVKPNEEIIFHEAPEAYRTILPVKDIVNNCRQNDLPAIISNTAGLYVCNRVYYEALHLGQRSVFIHIPNDFEVSKATDIIIHIIKTHLSKDEY